MGTVLIILLVMLYLFIKIFSLGVWYNSSNHDMNGFKWILFVLFSISIILIILIINLFYHSWIYIKYLYKNISFNTSILTYPVRKLYQLITYLYHLYER